MRRLVILGIVVLVGAIAVGTIAAAPEKRNADKTAAPEKKSGGPAVAPAASSSISGTILETMDSGGYTYMKLKTDRGEVWAAVNKAAVKKGSTATVVDPLPMQNFESKTLKRKFDLIYFGALAGPGAGGAPAEGAALPPGHPAVGTGDSKAMMAAQHAAAASGPADVGPIKVAKASGPGGKTVAEVFAQKTSLKDTPVAVRGKVVKVTREVMGKNWLHLRDGSGSADKKDNDLTVTTAGMAAIGDVVLVRGVVHLDRDFGAGYTYSVIIEDAQLSK